MHLTSALLAFKRTDLEFVISMAKLSAEYIAPSQVFVLQLDDGSNGSCD